MATAAVLPLLSSQSLTTTTTRGRTRNEPISRLLLFSPSPLPSSTPTQSLLSNQRRRQHPSFSIVACLPKSTSPISTKLYVSGLSFRTTEESLRNAFQNFGQLVEGEKSGYDVNLVMDRIANRPRGFAFLRYDTVEESQRAIEGMHGKFLDGRVIFVEVAKPRSELRQGSKQTQKY